MKQNLQQRFPHVDARQLADLALIWEQVATDIVDAMFRKAQEEIRLYNEKTRAELHLELAQLILHLEGIVLEEMLRDRSIEDLDVEEERARLQTAPERAKIENTGAVYYEHVWKKLVERAHAKHPLIRGPDDQTRRRAALRFHRPSGTQAQHFTPSFSNRRWAAGPQNQIREYRLSVGLEIVSNDKGFRSWGRADFLYSQALEGRLGLVEGDASPVYDKLLEMIPLSADEVHRWVAFIAAQHMRTPRYRTFVVRGLARHRFEEVRRARPEVLRRAYEEMFSSTPIFRSYHRLVTGHEWLLLSPPLGEQFIRADEPIWISTKSDPWRLVYPMTPTRCFVLAQRTSQCQTFAPVQQIGTADVNYLNRLTATHARASVIAKPMADDRQLKLVVRDGLLVGAGRQGGVTFKDDLWAGSLNGLLR